MFEDFYLNIELLSKESNAPDNNGNDGNAGYDIYSLEDYTLKPGSDVLIRSGWCCEFPRGYVMIIKDKSGRRWKGKLQTGAGVIDSNYRDEVMVLLKNIGDKTITINRGEKVAQFIITPVWNGTINIVEEVNRDDDRMGGFGATGLTKK
jgi:dUTP pyrophosphatase